jgi:hypothetical protein
MGALGFKVEHYPVLGCFGFDPDVGFCLGLRIVQYGSEEPLLVVSWAKLNPQTPC